MVATSSAGNPHWCASCPGTDVCHLPGQVLKWKHKRGHAGDKREDDGEVLPVVGSGGDASLLTMQPLLGPFSGSQGARSKGGALLSTLLGAGTKPIAKTNDE
jgi:hypothetical protein